MKGSMIMAPDGEIISVGGSVVPSRPHDVGVIGDVTQPHRHYDGEREKERERFCVCVFVSVGACFYSLILVVVALFSPV